MKPDHSKSEPEGLRPRLQAVRESLIKLHKALVDSERVEYEHTMGKIHSPNHFLQLLTSDPWFAWLSPLSQLIVSMDEALDAKEPLTAPILHALTDQAKKLVAPGEAGQGFARHYFDAMQRDPDVVLAHGDFTKAFRQKPAK